jgi:hypothetical protein
VPRRKPDPAGLPSAGLSATYPHVSAWTKPMLDGWEIARNTDIVGDRGVFRLRTDEGRTVTVTWTPTTKTSDNPQFRLSKPRIWDRYLWAVQFTINPPPEETFGPPRDAPAMAKSQREAGFPREAGVPVDSDPAHLAIAARFFSETGILTPGASIGENAPAYHRARVSARTGMRLLLTHVCERLAPLPRRHLGDDPFPTNWLVWALVWSAMNGHPSLRDQAALAADERAKGCVPFAPSAATLGRFTTSFATTPYLNGLVYALASPIRRMHPTEVLAVDGLGAGNKAQADYRLGLQRGHQSDRVVRWWQPVVMAHPRYGYVAAGTVTDSKTGEPTKAIEMVEALARYGDLGFMLGDGVYSSAEVMSAVVNAGGTPIIPWDAKAVNAIAVGKRGLFAKDAGIIDALYAMFERDRALFKRLTNWRSQVEGVISAMRRNTPGGMHIRCEKGAGPTNEFLAYCIRQNLWALYRASIVYGVDVNVFGVRFEEPDDDDGGDAGTVAA